MHHSNDFARLRGQRKELPAEGNGGKVRQVVLFYSNDKTIFPNPPSK